MENHSKVKFENSYNSLPETFFKRVKPEKMPDVGLFLVNQRSGKSNDFHKEIGGFVDPRDPVQWVDSEIFGHDKRLQRPPGPPRL